MTELIETAPHEFNANFNYDDGLQGYFALDSVVKQHDGSAEAEFYHDNEPWRVTLYYQDSNIVHPGDTTPTGTPFRIENIREFRMAVESETDSVGQRSFNAHIRPRWDGMKVEDDRGIESELSHPLSEGYNVRITGSNIEFQEYITLLQRAARALDINFSHFADPHGTSNVTQAERYVRVHKDHSGPVHARDGPMARLGHLLENDRHGVRKIEQRDMNERGEQLPGYRHQVGVDEQRVQDVFPNHQLPKRWKHYYAKEALNRDDALEHPKVGAIYYNSLWRDSDKKLGVSPDELEQLTIEIEEAVLSVLHEAGLDVTSTAPYIEDAYFEASTSDRERQVVDLPLREIEERQESVVIEHVADGLSPVEWEALEVLVTDGGQVSPQDIADSGGFHVDSVYRALDRMDEMIEQEYNNVSLRSTHVGQLVHDAITSAKERTREAVEAAGKVMDAADRGLDERTSAFVAWASKHLESFTEQDDGVEVRLGEIDADSHDDAMRQVREILREGYQLWTDARDEIDWRLGSWSARLRYPKHQLRSVEAEKQIKPAGGPLYQDTPGT